MKKDTQKVVGTTVMLLAVLALMVAFCFLAVGCVTPESYINRHARNEAKKVSREIAGEIVLVGISDLVDKNTKLVLGVTALTALAGGGTMAWKRGKK